MDVWNRETVPEVMNIVSSRLPQRDVIPLLLLSSSIHRNLLSHPSLWLVLDFREMNNAGDRLLAALLLSRYQNVNHINLEFSRDIEDRHLEVMKIKCGQSLKNLEILNLNGCQKISDLGIEFITSNCPKLKIFSIYWNVRVSDLGIKYLVKNCKFIIDLNLSGCKNVSDESLKLTAENYHGLQLLNLTRCIKLTDRGLKMILHKCSSLQSLNLYALSSFTDAAYKELSLLTNLQFLDLCGAQNLSDEGLTCIAKCKKLTSLNLTWCIRITDHGVLAIAEGCRSLEFLRTPDIAIYGLFVSNEELAVHLKQIRAFSNIESLFGIVGVTDRSLEALSIFCSSTITTLDVNGCTGIQRRSRDQLLQLFPKLNCFKVHS